MIKNRTAPLLKFIGMLGILLTFLVFNILLAGVAKWIVILLAAFVSVGFIFFGIDKFGKKK